MDDMMNGASEPAVDGSKEQMALEIEAMTTISNALLKLTSAEAQARVLAWVASALGIDVGNQPKDVRQTPRPARGIIGRAMAETTAPAEQSSSGYASVADLYVAAQPSADAEKALVIGYWFQVVEGQPDFDSQSVNGELRHLGYGVTNITQAFTNLMNRKPQLVIQTRKGGSSQQARKRLKLTTAGIQQVERMLASPKLSDEESS